MSTATIQALQDIAKILHEAGWGEEPMEETEVSEENQTEKSKPGTPSFSSLDKEVPNSAKNGRNLSRDVLPKSQ